MTNQMWQSFKTYVCCLQHEGSLSKAPPNPIMATAPLDLLHVDFTSIETTLELKQSPKVTNILLFQDHFMKHVLAYVTPDQTARTITRFLYQGYISIFEAPARFLSDRGANFMNSMNEGFSSCFSICNIVFNLLQDLDYLERQAFNRFSCLHQVLKKMFIPATYIYLKSVSENIMPNNIIYNCFEFCDCFV